MTFQYQDEDSGEPLQMYRLARAFSALKKSREQYSFLDVISWEYHNIAAAALRHAEFS